MVAAAQQADPRREPAPGHAAEHHGHPHRPAPGRVRRRIPLAGDQLYVDLDLSEAALPAGTRLAIGSAVVEITAQPHTGCAKFTERFGLEGSRFINSAIGTELRLRGVNAKVVADGEVRPGDRVRRI